MSKGVINLLLFSPLLIGGIIAIINSDEVNNTTENIEKWFRNAKSQVSLKRGWFNRFILNPILWSFVSFSDWTDDFAHRGLKNGIRVTLSLYLIIVWAYLLYAALSFAIMLTIIGVIFYILFRILINSSPDVKRGYDMGRGLFKQSNQKVDEEEITVGYRGQKIYSGTNWLNEELKGRVDDEGNIYSGSNWFNEEKIGRIGNDGKIYKGTNLFNEEVVGRIDENGNIHKGTNWFNEEKTGRIDEDGNIHKGTNWFNEEKTGRIRD